MATSICAQMAQAAEDAEDAELLQPVTGTGLASATRTAPSDLTFEALSSWVAQNSPAPSSALQQVPLALPSTS